ncbi:ADP-ribosylglycohydrolase family protein [Actinoplanes sp. NPDC020271]|uniref:ADP-ribosylglycohydrolase family protein n=1 Tax=Actinoplanes sp. NPDC020271 TaxID=3363896 RepID=UPI00379244C8
MIAVAVAAAMSTGDGSWTLAAVAGWTPAGQVRDGLRAAAEFPGGADPVVVAAAVGSGLRISAPDTVPYALWCAARHPNDLVATLWTTASAGGDVDTTCAVAGGVVGARTGLSGVPGVWRERCESPPGRVDRWG